MVFFVNSTLCSIIHVSRYINLNVGQKNRFYTEITNLRKNSEVTKVSNTLCPFIKHCLMVSTGDLVLLASVQESSLAWIDLKRKIASDHRKMSKHKICVIINNNNVLRIRAKIHKEKGVRRYHLLGESWRICAHWTDWSKYLTNNKYKIITWKNRA